MRKHYDMIAIGAGSGGLSAVERASEYGKKCAVVEFNLVGGTCVNVGCVPKKVMWFAANAAQTIKNSNGFGFDISINDFSARYQLYAILYSNSFSRQIFWTN